MFRTDVTELFCRVDDFMQKYDQEIKKAPLFFTEHGAGPMRQRDRRLNMSEIMTILILFQTSGYRTFKHFYQFLLHQCGSLFPDLVSYNRFIEFLPSAIVPMVALLNYSKGGCTGISFTDSTPLRVCGNKRIFNHKVFDGIAKKGKCSMGWFFGFKLHLIVNDMGELIAFKLTPGNTDDRVPLKENFGKDVFGKLFGDKGYISGDLFRDLMGKGVKLVTGIRSNMKNKLMPMIDKILLRKRSIIETINDQLKNVCQIEHSRHRSPTNFCVHLIAGLLAYTFKDKKPSLNLDFGKEHVVDPKEGLILIPN